MGIRIRIGDLSAYWNWDLMAIGNQDWDWVWNGNWGFGLMIKSGDQNQVFELGIGIEDWHLGSKLEIDWEL